MRNTIWLIALLLLLIIQAGILMPLHIFPVSLLIVVAALATLLSDFGQGLAISVIGGVVMDLVSGSPDGLISLSLVLTFLLMHWLFKEIFAREANRYILTVSVFGSTVIFQYSLLLFSQIFSWFGLVHSIDARYLLSTQLPLMIMWNLLFAYPIFLYYSIVQNLASKLPAQEETIKI